jgi:hypothetical protein
VAISNNRLVALTNGTVQFRWKDYADRDRVKAMTLTAEEFLRRFLLHIVPTRFMRIRHFGLLANRRRASALARCRRLLAAPEPIRIADTIGIPDAIYLVLSRCPVCRVGRWVVVATLPRIGTLPPDSS